MIVKCITVQESNVTKDYSRYAITTDRDGKLDISVGKYYVVYAVKEREKPKTVWYFVRVDNGYLWWMPSAVFVVENKTNPLGWIVQSDHPDRLLSYPSLGRWEIENGIIDSDKEAEDTYLAEVNKDPTFPTREQLDNLNRDFNKQRVINDYNEKAATAKERGWELPEKPEDVS